MDPEPVTMTKLYQKSLFPDRLLVFDDALGWIFGDRLHFNFIIFQKSKIFKKWQKSAKTEKSEKSQNFDFFDASMHTDTPLLAPLVARIWSFLAYFSNLLPIPKKKIAQGSPTLWTSLKIAYGDLKIGKNCEKNSKK